MSSTNHDQSLNCSGRTDLVQTCYKLKRQGRNRAQEGGQKCLFTGRIQRLIDTEIHILKDIGWAKYLNKNIV